MNDIVFKTLSGLMSLCVFRTSPSTLPFSKTMLMLIIVLTMLLNALEYNRVSGITTFEAVFAAVSSWGIFAALVYAILVHQQKAMRIHKALLALFGTELLLIILIKLLDTLSSGTMPEIVLVVSLWILFIKAYILKYSLEIKMGRALLITIGISFISSIPLAFIFNAQIQSQLL